MCLVAVGPAYSCGFDNQEFSGRSIPVIRKTHQLKKEEPQDKIEVHLAGCNNPIKPEVHHELYTE